MISTKRMFAFAFASAIILALSMHREAVASPLDQIKAPGSIERDIGLMAENPDQEAHLIERGDYEAEQPNYNAPTESTYDSPPMAPTEPSYEPEPEEKKYSTHKPIHKSKSHKPAHKHRKHRTQSPHEPMPEPPTYSDPPTYEPAPESTEYASISTRKDYV